MTYLRYILSLGLAFSCAVSSLDSHAEERVYTRAYLVPQVVEFLSKDALTALAVRHTAEMLAGKILAFISENDLGAAQLLVRDLDESLRELHTNNPDNHMMKFKTRALLEAILQEYRAHDRKELSSNIAGSAAVSAIFGFFVGLISKEPVIGLATFGVLTGGLGSFMHYLHSPDRALIGDIEKLLKPFSKCEFLLHDRSGLNQG